MYLRGHTGPMDLRHTPDYLERLPTCVGHQPTGKKKLNLNVTLD